MAISPGDLIQAFIEHAGVDADDDLAEPATAPPAAARVNFALRCPKGPGGGYVRVWGPSADPRRAAESHVIIEVHNGMVGVRAPLHQHLPGAVARSTAANITRDPLGYGCGPNFGPFTHALPASGMGPGTQYPTARDVVAAVLAAFGAAGQAW